MMSNTVGVDLISEDSRSMADFVRQLSVKNLSWAAGQKLDIVKEGTR